MTSLATKSIPYSRRKSWSPSCLAQFREHCPVIVQSDMGIAIETLRKYLCTGPLPKIQFFSSTPEEELTDRGKLTLDLVMVTLTSEHFPLTLLGMH